MLRTIEKKCENTSEQKTTLSKEEMKHPKSYAFIRRYLTQRKFKIKPLPDKMLTDHKTSVIGNDPEIKHLDKYESKDSNKPIIIGTSGMRSILIACKIGNKKNKKIIPQIILVDNSLNVITFWKELKKFTQCSKINNSKSFIDGFPEFIMKHQEHIYYEDLMDQTKDAIINFVKNLLTSYEFEYVKSIILNTTIIAQSWADTVTFNKIKNIIQYIQSKDTYAYPSNIYVCTEDTKSSQSILNNIAKINPKLCIQTDIDLLGHHPKSVYLFEEHDPNHVISTLFPIRSKPKKEVTIKVGGKKFGLFDEKDRYLIEYAINTYGNKITDRLVQVNQLYVVDEEKKSPILKR